MTSKRKAAANKLNGRKSRGPTTPEGKAVCAQARTHHGLLSSVAVLPTEDTATFAAFERDIHDALRPEGALERLLASRVVTSAWRLRRAVQAETEAFVECRDAALCMSLDGTANIGAAFRTVGSGLETLGKYEAGIDRALYRGLHELQRLQAMRAGQAVSLPICVDADVSVTGCPGGQHPGDAKVP